jgi:hypothetical protein
LLELNGWLALKTIEALRRILLTWAIVDCYGGVRSTAAGIAMLAVSTAAGGLLVTLRGEIKNPFDEPPK